MASHSSILIDLGDDVVDVEDSAAATESEDSPQVATDEEGDQWKTPFLQTLCSDSVRIYVGKERELFTFHKDLLCSISGFFRAAFTGKFSEAAKQEMELDDVKVACFAKFVEWVYRDTFTIAHTILGDRFLCVGFKDLIMDKIQDELYCHSAVEKKFSLCLTYRQIKKILEKTISTADAPIRKFCAASVSYYLRHGGLEEKVCQIFQLDGFTKEYVAFQSAIWKEEDRRNTYIKFMGLRSDPRIRKLRSSTCGKKYCSCPRYNYGSGHTEDDSGFPICFFHVHNKDKNCSSVSNNKSDCNEENAW